MKREQGSIFNPIYTRANVTFGIVSTIVTTAIGLWFLNVIGVEARVAHTLGDFIRLVSESA